MSAETPVPPAVALARVGRRRRWQHFGPATWICGGIIALLVLVAVLAPLISPYKPTDVDIFAINQGPSSTHLLGTDQSGRDLFSRLLEGSRPSLLAPMLVVLIAVALGTSLAVLAAWRGGRLDRLVARSADALFAFPGILIAILAVAVFGRGLIAPVVALGIANAPYIIRVTRAAAIRERALPYIEALEVQGLSALRIAGRHLLPNLAPLVAAQATVAFAYSMVNLAAISFLGLGVQPPDPDWGVMVAEGQAAMLQGHPEAVLASGLTIIVTVICVGILGSRLTAPAEGVR